MGRTRRAACGTTRRPGSPARATDEFHNPTIALGLPWVGMWVLAYPWRLNTALCGADGCQEPTCEDHKEA